MKKKTVAINLDGVLAYYTRWNGVVDIGKPIDGAKEFVDRVAKRYYVLVYTCRTNEKLNKHPLDYLTKLVEDWLTKHDFNYDEVWKGQGKPQAIMYVDDRGWSCTPQIDDEAFDKVCYMLGV